ETVGFNKEYRREGPIYFNLSIPRSLRTVDEVLSAVRTRVSNELGSQRILTEIAALINRAGGQAAAPTTWSLPVTVESRILQMLVQDNKGSDKLTLSGTGDITRKSLADALRRQLPEEYGNIKFVTRVNGIIVLDDNPINLPNAKEIRLIFNPG